MTHRIKFNMAIPMANITEEQRLEKAVEFVLNYSGLECICGMMLYGERYVSETLPTACTDGVDTWYGRSWIAKISDPVLRFTVIHEEFHKALCHTTVYMHLYKKDPECANKAVDFAINLPIKDIADASNGKIEVPDMALLDEKYRGMSAFEIFKELYEEKHGGGGGGGGEPEEGDGGKGDEQQGHDEHDWSRSEQMSPEDLQEHQEKVKELVEQGRKLAETREVEAGKGAGGLDDLLSEFLEPRVDWRAALRNYLTQRFRGTLMATFSRLNRRMLAQGRVWPSRYDNRIAELMDACDTSGSMWGYQQQVRSELVALAEQLKPKVLHHVDWDTVVEQHEIIRDGDGEKVKGLRVTGGGGTDPSCIPNYLREKNLMPKVVVVLTDGYFSNSGNWPTGVDVLWIIFGNKSWTPPAGHTAIHVDERDFH